MVPDAMPASGSFRDRLQSRVADARLTLSADAAERFEHYYRLLSKWNSRFNLTALPLESFPAASLDRLLVEPLRAAELVANTPLVWFDLGSGGGSPAIPLLILRPAARLTMVDSSERKSAFLREAIREVDLQGANVLTARIEELRDLVPGENADLVTIRAVRFDESIRRAADHLLRQGGRILRFGAGNQAVPDGFRTVLGQNRGSAITITVFEKV